MATSFEAKKQAIMKYFGEVIDSKKALSGQHTAKANFEAIHDTNNVAGKKCAVIGIDVFSYTVSEEYEANMTSPSGKYEVQANRGTIDETIKYLKENGGLPYSQLECTNAMR